VTASVVISDPPAENKLLQLEIAIRTRVLKRAVRAAAQPVEKRAKDYCPRSRDSGTREEWSKKTQAERAGVKDLVDTITTVVREYQGPIVAVVGPAYPAGALGHLVEFSGEHKQIQWGRDDGRTITAQPFLRPAADETKAEQRAEFEAVLKRATRNV
jgi:hypothetical protein